MFADRGQHVTYTEYIAHDALCGKGGLCDAYRICTFVPLVSFSRAIPRKEQEDIRKVLSLCGVHSHVQGRYVLGHTIRVECS